MTWLDKALLKYGTMAVVILCATAVLGYGCGQKRRGEIEERIKRQTQGVVQQGKRADSIRTVYVHDTVTAYRYLTEWDHIVDTLRLDTLSPPIRTVIVAADSAIRSCTRALHDCDALQRAEHDRADSALALAESYRNLSRAPFVSGNLGAYKRVDSTGYLVSGGLRVGRTWAAVARGDLELPSFHVKDARGRLYVGADRRF